MSISLDPTELGFRRPFTTEVVETLNIRNTNYEPIAFKVKTTAPKLYCVRPNSGRIEPGQQVQVQVILQAMKEDPPLDVKCKDKFLVQSAAITADRESGNLVDIWNHVDKSDIQEKKIRVVFLPKTDSTSLNGRHEADETAPTASTDPHLINSAPVGSISRVESRPENYTPTREAASHAHPSSGYTSSPVSESAKLAELKATIADLERQLREVHQGGLRQRRVNSDNKERAEIGTLNPVALAQQAPEGVPVKIVALLCLVSFLLALLF